MFGCCLLSVCINSYTSLKKYVVSNFNFNYLIYDCTLNTQTQNLPFFKTHTFIGYGGCRKPSVQPLTLQNTRSTDNFRKTYSARSDGKTARADTFLGRFTKPDNEKVKIFNFAHLLPGTGYWRIIKAVATPKLLN